MFSCTFLIFVLTLANSDILRTRSERKISFVKKNLDFTLLICYIDHRKVCFHCYKFYLTMLFCGTKVLLVQCSELTTHNDCLLIIPVLHISNENLFMINYDLLRYSLLSI